MTVRVFIIYIATTIALLGGLFGCTKRLDPDEAVIVQLRKAGSDLSRPHAIDFYLYFPNKSAAEEAAARMRDTGYQTEVKRAAKGDNWLCLGKKKVIPKLPTIQGITRDLDALAKSYGGDYDGWEAEVVR